MPAIDSTLPPRDTYRFVLRRYDRAPNRSIRVSGYDEVAHSRAVKMGDVVAQTIFVRSKHLAKRAWKLGWKDETKQWDEWLDGLNQLTSEQRAVLETLREHGPCAKRELIERCDVADDFNYRQLLMELRELDLVEKIGSNRNTKYRAI
jgi:hypothetical protein